MAMFLQHIEANSEDRYQFVYITKKKEIAGISQPFTIGASLHSTASSSSSESSMSDLSICYKELFAETNQQGDAQIKKGARQKYNQFWLV